MVDLEYLGRKWVALLVSVLSIGPSGAAEPPVIAPRWQADFPLLNSSGLVQSIAVPADGRHLMVVVIAPGADPLGMTLRVGERQIPALIVGHDPVSRLAFVRIEGDVLPKSIAWAEKTQPDVEATLQSIESAGPVKCRSSGWVKQVGGKILPLALLRVNFSRKVPPPGTPLVDEAGRVVAIVFQASGNGTTGYAIPAEAVHRVRQDVQNGGLLTRGWLGLALRAELQMPEISRVLPDSPAAAAGIRPNDVLLTIGSRPIADYADAVNAFFYLIPGQQVRVKLLRDAEQLEFCLTPTIPKS